jgi:hypothetical protein
MKKTILILVVLAAVVVGGCNKTKQTLNKIYGDYTLKSYTVNGVDSLSLYKDSLGINFRFYYEEENSINGLFIDGVVPSGKDAHIVSSWGLINKNKVLQIYTTAGSNGTGPFGNMITPEWEILTLTKKEFKMKTTYNNKEYEIELE